MASNNRDDKREVFTENTKSGESFDFTKENTDSVWGEYFVYKFEENKATFTNNNGKDGKEENDNSSSIGKGKEKDRDNDEELKEESADSASTASSTSSTASSTSSSVSTSTTAATSTAAASTAGVVQAVATVATTAVVFVVGGGIVLTSVAMPTPDIVQFDHMEASIDSIYYSILIGNNEETIRSGDEHDECYIRVELKCEKYTNIYRVNEIRNFGVHEGVFEDLASDTEYTINVYKSDFAGLQTEYLIEPIFIKTLYNGVPESLSLNTDEVSIRVDETYQASIVSSVPDNANRNVTWRSDNPEVATVDENGLIKGVSVGTVNIIASSVMDETVSDTLAVTVLKRVPASIELNSSEQEIKIGETFQIVPRINPTDADDRVIYTSDDDQIASVSEDGLILGVSEGTTTIRCTSTIDDNVYATLTVIIYEETDVDVPPTKITLNEESVELIIDETYELSVATCEPMEANRTVTWSTDNEEVASVSEEGLVTALIPGTCVITATSILDDTVTASCTITVNPKVAMSITLNSEGESLDIEDEFQIVAAVEPEGADQGVTFVSEDTGIAIVSEDGLVTAVAPGETTISVTSKDTRSRDCVAYLPVYVYAEIEDISLEDEVVNLASPGDTYQCVVTVNPNNANPNVTYVSEDETVVTVSEDGLITAVGEGDTFVTVTSVKNNDINFTLSVHVGALYSMNFSILENGLGEEKYIVSFDVENETTTYSSYKVALVQNRDEKTITVAQANLTGDITQTQELHFDGTFDNQGTYTVQLIGEINEGETSSTKVLHSEEINFGDVQRQETHSNQLLITKNEYVDLNGDAITTLFDIYVDSESEEFSSFDHVSFYARSDTQRSNEYGRIREESYRTKLTDLTLFENSDSTVPDELTAVVYNSTPTQEDTQHVDESYSFDFKLSELEGSQEQFYSGTPTFSFYRSYFNKREIRTGLEINEDILGSGVLSITFSYEDETLDPLTLNLTNISDGLYSLANSGSDAIDLSTYESIYDYSDLGVNINVIKNNAEYTIYSGTEDFSSGIIEENYFDTRVWIEGKQDQTGNITYKLTLYTPEREPVENPEYTAQFQVWFSVDGSNYRSIENVTPGEEVTVDDADIEYWLSTSNQSEIVIEVQYVVQNGDTDVIRDNFYKEYIYSSYIQIVESV